MCMPAGLAVAAVADVVGTGREISPMGSWFCIMGGGFFPDELTRYEAFSRRVAELVEIIVRKDVRAAAADAVAGRAARFRR